MRARRASLGDSKAGMGTCKLCLKVRPLVEGHVLSEFLYADLYDPDRHKFHEFHTDSTKRNVRRSSGYYERMMCDDCDNRIISGYETYGARVLNRGVELLEVNEDGCLVSRGVDYADFKLFQISLLWRSVISTRDEFRNISVAPQDAERMRQMLFERDPGEPQEYGCVMLIPERYDQLKHAILPPEYVRLDRHGGFRLLAGGFWWLYLVSDDGVFEHKEYFLSTEGTLRCVYEDRSNNFINQLARDLVKNPTFPKCP
ncbi:MAG: hypothetical protein J0L64_26140 [Acidobacteria bacterium]|nr:hypothetical protein [Acidobacteriota bacterium]